jgi:XTP/dITP diphosphohydrolase
MNHLYFATSNETKFLEAKTQLNEAAPDALLDRVDIDIPEIQSDDPDEIIRQKIEFVHSQTTKPFLVDDTSFDTDRYLGFPGSYAKFVNNKLGLEGMRRLFENGDEIRAVARLAFSYLDEIYQFEGSIQGELQLDNVQSIDPNAPLNSLIRLDDGRTLGDALEDPSFQNHRGIAIGRFANWLCDQENGIDTQRRNISQRWTNRSGEWKDMIEDDTSYVNFENNYARVNAMIRRTGPKVSGKALEIGCGTGEAGRILKESNPALQLLSTDISSGMLEQAKEQTRDAGLDIAYQEADITKTDLGTDTYGIILSRGVVISHLPRGNVYDFLESVTRLSKEDGYFLFDFMQSEKVGDVEKPIDSKNEFTIEQLDALLGELGWVRVDDDGTDAMRVRVACYQKKGMK